MTSIHFSPSVASDARVRVTVTQTADGGQPSFRLSEPGRLARLGRGTLNLLSHVFCFIPGIKYTKNWYNPKQWSAFRNAIVAIHSDDIKNGRLKAADLDDILAGYSPHKRLTQGKASAILADVQSRLDGHAILPRRPDRLNSSQFPLLRATRSLYGLARGLGDEARALRNAETRNPDSAAKTAVLDILRAGQPITNHSVTTGQIALKQFARGQANFEFSSAGLDNASTTLRLQRVLTADGDKIAELRQAATLDSSKPALLSIPLILWPKALSLHERHVVALVVDFRNEKLLYLDPKGESIEAADRHYDSGDVAQALRHFGEQLFADRPGNLWSPDTGVVQMTQAKQQGENNCGPLSHLFVRQLIEAHTVGDIERTVGPGERDDARLEMARLIVDHRETVNGVNEPQDDQLYVKASPVKLKLPEQRIEKPLDAESLDSFFEVAPDLHRADGAAGS